MPSRLITELSNFMMAVLIASGFGRAVRPMLIAFERFVSRIVISFFAPSCFCNQKSMQTLNTAEEVSIHVKLARYSSLTT